MCARAYYVCPTTIDQYRICKKGESHYNLTEECFQGADPSRGGPLSLTDASWIQYGAENNRTEFKPTRTRAGTYPPNSQWSRNPIALCGDQSEGVDGIFDDGCNTTKFPTQFPPVAPGAFGKSQICTTYTFRQHVRN
eukprot:COSAG06_NODE_3257_length_5607_cov_4.727487_5_plen_137_part_00